MINLDFLSNNYEEKKTPAQKIEEELKIHILTGRLASGQRIIEQQLCDKYQLSRTPVREILHKLEAEGLIETIPNRGAVVRGFTPQEIDDFFYLKSNLEVQCVRWAIERITDKELEILEEIFEFMEFYTISNDLSKMVRINRGFDAILYNASHNREIETTLHRYNFYLYHATAQIAYPPDYLTSVLEEHRSIYEAFRAKDVEAGAAATEIHMMKYMLRRK